MQLPIQNTSYSDFWKLNVQLNNQRQNISDATISYDHCLKPSLCFDKINFSFKPRPAEREIFTDEHAAIYSSVLAFLENPDKSFLPSELQAIFCYLKGKCSLEDLPITELNARAYLTKAKILDLAISQHNRRASQKITFPNSSFALRTRILELSSPLMTTSEAYTKTLDPRKFKDRRYLSVSNHWVPERAAQHVVIAANQLVLMQQLSRSISTTPIITAYRGNTAAGKSEAVRKDLKAVSMDAKTKGVINPDIAKFYLRRRQLTDKRPFLINNQVHEECIAFVNNMTDGIMQQAARASLVVEGRFSTLAQFKNYILRKARIHKKEVRLRDFASPLIISLYRVLARDPFTSQCPPLQEIIKGYKESIFYRHKLLDMVSREPIITNFKLHYQDLKGRKHLVAQKKKGEITLPAPKLLDKCCESLNDKEIEQLLQQPITHKQIEKAVKRGYIPKSARPLLEGWTGIPMGKAIDIHSLGLPANSATEIVDKQKLYMQKYGEYEMHPFDGSWLSDFPSLVEHIRSEQLLNVYTLDEKGEGVHWPAEKFSSKLDVKFNPAAQLPDSPLGGFQMQIGYFIIPLEHADTMMSKNISPDELQELHVCNEKGDCVGYRLFVHPEAYSHYRSLHAAEIPFVTPTNSEFMGTPTSSYRSWVVRRISTTQKTSPFIVKFGVSSSPSDINKLLSKDVVEHSLKTQARLEEISPAKFARGAKGSDLVFFQENFGLTLKGIENYPPSYAAGDGSPVDSGMIVRKIPQELLEGCKFLSMSALMSAERTRKSHYALCHLISPEKGGGPLPLIYEVIQAAVDKKLVKNSEHFIRKYFIEGYLEAIEELYLRQGIAFSPHGQNLCMVLNPDNTPRGWCYRDLEGMSTGPQQGYLETYSWFYRYHVFVKLLNVLVLNSKHLASLFGPPTQLGMGEGMPERALYSFITKNIGHTPKIHASALGMLFNLHISPQDYQYLIFQLDKSFLEKLDKYFHVAKAGVVKRDGTLPSAEGGSSAEPLLRRCNESLWKYRRA